MKYWYLKDGDILGPKPAEEIAKDEAFAQDILVCPEDKAEQAEFWKPAQSYSEDFSSFLKQEEPGLSTEAEMDIPQEIALDDIEVDFSNQEKQEGSKESDKEPNIEPAQEQEEKDIFAKENILEQKPQDAAQDTLQDDKANSSEDKNPFDTDRPQIAPNLEDTISNHVIAPRLDADGDTLLEDIPAKAILDAKEITQPNLPPAKEEEQDLVASISLPTEDTLEDTPILNIFENTQPKNNVKELKDISESIYDTYGTDSADKKSDIKIKELSELDKRENPVSKSNKKIYLLLVSMFVLVAIALFLAVFGSGSEGQKNNQQKVSLPADLKPLSRSEQQNKKDNFVEEESLISQVSQEDFDPSKAVSLDKTRALTKVQTYTLPNGKTLEAYLNEKYNGYQTNWVADVLSGRNYFVHFNASKVRQEPLVYSFSIDLDKNEINGLNNLGMDLLVKGE